MSNCTRIIHKAIHFKFDDEFYPSMSSQQKETSQIMECFSFDRQQNCCIQPLVVNLQMLMIEITFYIPNPVWYQKVLVISIQSIISLHINQLFLKRNPQSFLKRKLQMQKHEHTSLKEALSKQEVQQHFAKMFEDQANTECFECGKKSKQWAERNHAIFLCLNCASTYKQLKWACEVKSIGLDLWSKKQLETMARGGNRRFKQHLTYFQVQTLPIDKKLKTKAAQYYRILLIEETNGRQAPEAPTLEEGKKFVQNEIPLTEMSPEEILEYTKEKALWLGSKTVELGGRAKNKIEHKITSGELKEDVKKVGRQVKTKAKDFWKFASSKIKEITNKNEQPRNPQL